jgi:hypothetical protein
MQPGTFATLSCDEGELSEVQGKGPGPLQREPEHQEARLGRPVAVIRIAGAFQDLEGGRTRGRASERCQLGGELPMPA